MAKRKGYEKIRLEDKTAEAATMQEEAKRVLERRASPPLSSQKIQDNKPNQH